MKKVLTLCMALILVLTAAVTMLASCGGGNTPSDDTNKPVGGGNTDSSERIPLDVPEKATLRLRTAICWARPYSAATLG